MENRFIDQAAEVLGNRIADVIYSETDEESKREKVIELFMYGAKKDLSMSVKTTEEEKMEERNLEVQIWKDEEGVVLKRLVVYTTDEVPFEKMMKKNEFVLYTEIPIKSLIHVLKENNIDYILLESIKGDILLPKSDILDFDAKK